MSLALLTELVVVPLANLNVSPPVAEKVTPLEPEPSCARYSVMPTDCLMLVGKLLIVNPVMLAPNVMVCRLPFAQSTVNAPFELCVVLYENSLNFSMAPGLFFTLSLAV